MEALHCICSGPAHNGARHSQRYVQWCRPLWVNEERLERYAGRDSVGSRGG